MRTKLFTNVFFLRNRLLFCYKQYCILEMHLILQQLLDGTFTYYHQISCKNEGDIKQKLL